MSRILTIHLFLLISLTIQAQYLKVATFAAWGGTSSQKVNYMSQVLGQSSVIIGTANSQGLVFRQGFKQPVGPQKSTNSSLSLQIHEKEKAWSYITFPNPFIDLVTVRFDQPTANPVFLQVYDIQGQVLWQGQYMALTKEIALEKLQDLKAGKYILQVMQKEKAINQTLIKQSN